MENKSFNKYANSFQTVINLSLHRIECMLELLSNPQDKLKFIHVAGTNGKGSVCAFLQSMLSSAGYKTGKYISPNLVKVNERISIDGNEISDAALEKLLEKVRMSAEETQKKTGEMPSQFEIWTAAAFEYFMQESCDYVVLETGLGGRFDATNIIKTPAVSVITRIGLDHTEFLGDTLSDIAGEKAGIIKNGVPVVTVAQNDEVMHVLQQTCAERGCSVTVAVVPESSVFSGIYEQLNYKEFDGIMLGIGGIHQIENAVIAVETARVLKIEDEYIKKGLETAKNPARFEMVDADVPVIFDGAHNPCGAQMLKKSVERYFPGKEKIYIMAMMHDKDIKNVLKILNDGKSTFYFVPVRENSRAAMPEQLVEIAHECNLNAIGFDDILPAYNDAAGRGMPVIICGSLYLYKDLALMEENA